MPSLLSSVRGLSVVRGFAFHDYRDQYWDLDIDEEARRACVLMCVHFHQVMLRKKEDLSPYSILCLCKIHVAFCAHALMTSMLQNMFTIKLSKNAFVSECGSSE